MLFWPNSTSRQKCAVLAYPVEDPLRTTNSAPTRPRPVHIGRERAQGCRRRLFARGCPHLCGTPARVVKASTKPASPIHAAPGVTHVTNLASLDSEHHRAGVALAHDAIDAAANVPSQHLTAGKRGGDSAVV